MLALCFPRACWANRCRRTPPRLQKRPRARTRLRTSSFQLLSSNRWLKEFATQIEPEIQPLRNAAVRQLAVGRWGAVCQSERERMCADALFDGDGERWVADGESSNPR